MSTYKDAEYWRAIQEQEMREEQERWECKCERDAELMKKSETPVTPEKKKWTEQEIKDLVQTNDVVLYRALRTLYDQQTADEQRAGETKVYNNAGFNGADSRFLSSVSEFLLKTGFLTDKQKVVVRKKLVKYTKQLTRLANA